MIKRGNKSSALLTGPFSSSIISLSLSGVSLFVKQSCDSSRWPTSPFGKSPYVEQPGVLASVLIATRWCGTTTAHTLRGTSRGDLPLGFLSTVRLSHEATFRHSLSPFLFPLCIYLSPRTHTHTPYPPHAPSCTRVLLPSISHIPPACFESDEFSRLISIINNLLHTAHHWFPLAAVFIQVIVLCLKVILKVLHYV